MFTYYSLDQATSSEVEAGGAKVCIQTTSFGTMSRYYHRGTDTSDRSGAIRSAAIYCSADRRRATDAIDETRNIWVCHLTPRGDQRKQRRTLWDVDIDEHEESYICVQLKFFATVHSS